MKEPKFLPLKEEYLRGEVKGTERAYDKTMLDGWEKRHYIPDEYKPYDSLTEDERRTLKTVGGPKFHFLDNQDETVYISPNEEFVLRISRELDVVSIKFIFDENSAHCPQSSGHYIHEEWTRAVAVRSDLDKIKQTHDPIIAGTALPDLNTFTSNAYYLARNQQNTILYHIDAYEGRCYEMKRMDRESTLLQVQEALSNISMHAQPPNIKLDINSSDNVPVSPAGVFNTKIALNVIPFNIKSDLTKLKASLEVFQRHFGVPNAVVEDAHRVLDAHRENFLSHRQWLANRLNEDPAGMKLQVHAILKRFGIFTSLSEHLFRIIKWYAEHDLLEIAILLQQSMMGVPYMRTVYADVLLYIRDQLMLDKNIGTDKHKYYERLSEVALECADATKDKNDLTFAMRILSQLSGGDGFTPDLHVDQTKIYLNLLVKYASQVGKLKREIDASKNTVNAPVLVAAPRASSPVPAVASSKISQSMSH